MDNPLQNTNSTGLDNCTELIINGFKGDFLFDFKGFIYKDGYGPNRNNNKKARPNIKKNRASAA